MKNEIKWEIELDGVPHTILCVVGDNGYDIYDGDDHVTKVYMKSFMHSLRGGVEKDIDIAGHTVTFIAWDRFSPDIAVDGVKIGENIPYEEARRRQKKASVVVFAVGLAVCAVMFCGILPQVFLVPDKAVTYAVDAAAFFIAGAFCLHRLLKLKK
ncbi:MAG: hypothetical protein IJ386_02010 [Clostridia bacterium]|nr:hypothetical protein [Clostridia bacterium]